MNPLVGFLLLWIGGLAVGPGPAAKPVPEGNILKGDSRPIAQRCAEDPMPASYRLPCLTPGGGSPDL